jgi:putative membrane protein
MRGRGVYSAAVIGCAAAVGACQPYYYGYGGYGPYADAPYGYGPYAGYAAPAPPYSVPQPLSQISQDFAVNLALNDSYEILAARLAALNGGLPEIRRFADRMANEHTIATQRLTTALQRIGTPVEIPETLDQRHDAMIQDLAVPPPEFDRRYVIQQVVAHRDALAILQNYARSGDNPALRQLAVEMLPMVQEHLRLAQILAGAGV